MQEHINSYLKQSFLIGKLRLVRVFLLPVLLTIVCFPFAFIPFNAQSSAI